MHDPIALAVPFFFVLIGLELAWAKKRGARVYRFNDAVTDLSCGITSQIVLLAWAATQLAIYAWLYERARLVTIAPAWIAWIVAFVGVDFLYYWWHRLSHEVNLLWAAHVVHHQSEDYNLAVALRQSVITNWTVLPFYLPLALVGVPTLAFATMVAISTLYQFWIHTQLVGRMRGPLDWIFNLPSHHRVHHAINPPYLDKNYGAILIVWDRLFGTYADEEETPVYGITKPLGSFNPFWAQVHYWVEMRAMVRACTRLSDKLRVPFVSPAWKPPGATVEEHGPLAERAKYDPPMTPRMARYIAAQYAVLVVAMFFLLKDKQHIVLPALVMASLAVLGALVSVGALIEGRRWARGAEVTRLLLGVVALAMVLRR